MHKLNESILSCLHQHSGNDLKLINRLQGIITANGDIACSELLKILTHVQFPPEKAKTYWTNILAHHLAMGKKLERKVCLRTAICDYFCSIEISLKNPKMIEIPLYEDEMNSSRTDSLTGLYSRKYFKEAIEREITSATRHNRNLSIVFFDLDHFKQVNDKFGHLAGDYVLQQVSKIIIKEKRTEDVAVRFGGEEIVVLLPDTAKIQALIVAERIRKNIANTEFVYDDKVFGVTISGGVATLPGDGRDAVSLTESADSALYKAKSMGRNQTAMFLKHKRKYLRFDYSGEVCISLINDKDYMNFSVNSKNLSQSGILIESIQAFDIGSRVHLYMPIEGFAEPFSATGTVVRVESCNNGLYDIGIAFLEYSNEVFNEIFGDKI